MKKIVGALCGMVIVLGASSAFAQNDVKKDDVQIMDFKEVDKLVSAMGMSDTMKIGAGHGPLRVLLVRPRTNFVPELYKSIENL